ncbi:MAG: triose-phosphate isomerase [Bacillaceae bacterium G1]|nr:triose-phosphate isomerase [Bacillota bacterium]OJF17559.1 MAG: triose-phosphate isomerase [Bacillaceae bacterium G1]
MERTLLIAGNWKMHHTPAETEAFLDRFLADGPVDGCEVVLCPPFTSLSVVAERWRTLSQEWKDRLGIGAQNVHWEEKGAFTGEISPRFLQAWSVEYVIVGHSERRTWFGETDETVARKVQAAVAHGMVPIVCVGEDLAEREAGQTEEKVSRQVAAAVQHLRAEQAERLVVAYEPIWAIGSGKTPTPEEVGQVLRRIRAVLQDRFGQTAADRVRVLYGGSVSAANIGAWVTAAEADGALVGGASLEPTSFRQLIRQAVEAKKKGSA